MIQMIAKSLRLRNMIRKVTVTAHKTIKEVGKVVKSLVIYYMSSTKCKDKDKFNNKRE